MSYAQTESVEAGKKFKSPSGLPIETTGTTQLVESHDVFVHEVVIVEGVGKGHKFLLNLDAASEG